MNVAKVLKKYMYVCTLKIQRHQPKQKQKTENINNNNSDGERECERERKKSNWNANGNYNENYIHIAKYIMSAQSVNETLPACQGSLNTLNTPHRTTCVHIEQVWVRASEQMTERMNEYEGKSRRRTKSFFPLSHSFTYIFSISHTREMNATAAEKWWMMKRRKKSERKQLVCCWKSWKYIRRADLLYVCIMVHMYIVSTWLFSMENHFFLG